MPTIIIEDGTIVAGANSYVTEAEMITYASDRGIDIDDTSIDVGIYLIKAKDYLEGKEHLFKGNRVDEDQVLAWPREYVWINSFELIGEEESWGTLYAIPQQVKNAQMCIALYIHNGTVLQPITGNNLKRKKIGLLEKEYFQGGSQPYLGELDSILRPICKDVGILSVGRA